MKSLQLQLKHLLKIGLTSISLVLICQISIGQGQPEITEPNNTTKHQIKAKQFIKHVPSENFKANQNVFQAEGIEKNDIVYVSNSTANINTSKYYPGYIISLKEINEIISQTKAQMKSCKNTTELNKLRDELKSNKERRRIIKKLKY